MRYKTGVIKTFLYRAHSICSSWIDFHKEIERIRKLLINNNFPIGLIDKTINSFLKNKFKDNENIDNASNNDINLYFKGHFSDNYKQKEETLRKIIMNNIEPKETKAKINVITYYKTNTIKNLVIQNNPKKVTLDQTNNVVYQYTCPEVGCSSNKQQYIGYTTNTIRKRMTQHSYNGAIRKHHEEKHNIKIQYPNIIKNIEVLEKCNKQEDLLILEALHIKSRTPILNQ